MWKQMMGMESMGLRGKVPYREHDVSLVLVNDVLGTFDLARQFLNRQGLSCQGRLVHGNRC